VMQIGTASVLARVAPLLLYCVACGRGAPAGSSSLSEPAPLPPPQAALPSATETPSDARTTGSVPKERPAECLPPVRVSPQTVAREWPRLVGRRVFFSCRVVRAVGFTNYLVAGDGAMFIVVAGPESPPCKPSTSTFTITGASHLAVHGRTVLPELVVDDSCRR
jgi:hypothetical protein